MSNRLRRPGRLASLPPVIVGPPRDNASPNILFAGQVPQLALLPHMSAVVTHGGHNTVCEALACGLPVVTTSDPDNLAQHLAARSPRSIVCDPSPSAVADAIAAVLAAARRRDSSSGTLAGLPVTSPQVGRRGAAGESAAAAARSAGWSSSPGSVAAGGCAD